MALFEVHIGGILGVVARRDDGLAVVNVQDVDVFVDFFAAAAFALGRLFAFGQDIDAVAALEGWREGLLGGPPRRILAEGDVVGYLAAVLAAWSALLH